MDVFVRVAEGFGAGSAGAGVGAGVGAGGAVLGAAEHVDALEGVVDLAEGPGAGAMPGRFLRGRGLAGLEVVGAGVLVLVADVVRVEVEEGLELGDHPGQGDVGDALVRVAAADVGVHAWEPDLAEHGLVVARFLPHGGLEGGAPLVERERLERVLDAVAQAGVVEVVLLDGAALQAHRFEPGDAWDAEGSCVSLQLPFHVPRCEI